MARAVDAEGTTEREYERERDINRERDSDDRRSSNSGGWRVEVGKPTNDTSGTTADFSGNTSIETNVNHRDINREKDNDKPSSSSSSSSGAPVETAKPIRVTPEMRDRGREIIRNNGGDPDDTSVLGKVLETIRDATDSVSGWWDKETTFSNDKKEYESASETRKKELEDKYRNNGDYGKLSLLKETPEERETREKEFRSDSNERANTANKPKLNSSGSVGNAIGNPNRTIEVVTPKYTKPVGTAYNRNQLPTSMNLSKFISPSILGINDAYDISTWDWEHPDLQAIVGALRVKNHDDNGVFIGSLPVTYPYVRHDELDPDWNTCTDWSLCLPRYNIPQGAFDWIDDLVKKDSLTWKTIDEINKLAEDVDKVPEAKQLISFLSQEYKSIPEQIREKLHPDVMALIRAYHLVNIPDKEPEYKDLDAYLNAPFPELKLKEQEDNEELNKLLEQLKDLKLEDLDVPIIKPQNDDVTDRSVNGEGIFDHLASSIFNQLKHARDMQLISKDEIAKIYSNFLVQGVQTAVQFALEKHNITLQSYQAKLASAQASVAILEAKTRLLMLPSQLRLQYAQVEAQLEQINLLRVQVELEKEKFPQVVANTDLILAQTDGQRLGNEQAQVAIQQGKLGLAQTQEQIALTREQMNQYQLNTELLGIQIEQEKEKTTSMVLSNNKLIEDTKMVDAQTQHQLKQVELADIQKIEAKARIKMLAQQLEKEKEQMGLAKAQIATSYAQLALIRDQLKTSRAQYSDTIDGKPVGGLIGAQIAVNKVQASSFERKAFNDLLQQVQSGWSTNKTADIAISSPASFTPLVVDRVINWGFSKYFNMPNDIVKLPYNYTPYLTDEQMDAEEPVNYKTKKDS